MLNAYMGSSHAGDNKPHVAVAAAADYSLGHVSIAASRGTLTIITHTLQQPELALLCVSQLLSGFN